MDPSSIEANQADFSGTYRPIDAPQYHNEQAQLYYEQMRAHVNEKSRSVLTGGGVRTTGKESFYQMVGGGRYRPSEREYRTHTRRRKTYADDVSERLFQAPMHLWDAAGMFAADFGVAEPVEQFADDAFRGLGYGMAGSTMRSMAVGGAVGLGAWGAVEGGTRYTGLRDAFKQFDEVQQFRGISRPIVAGTASDPNGRMSRDMAQNVMTNLAEQGRMSPATKDGEGLDELKEQVGVLADYRLLEGVQSADEFEKKFNRLKEGVKRVMEVLGTTFEEGAELMKDFRNVGVSPTKGVDLLNEGRLTSAQFGVNFQQSHAAGMQSALAMRGTGLTMGAGYRMGQYASGMAQQIYEWRYLDDSTMYNLGGQQGVRMALQRGQMNYMQSAPFTAMMMGSQTGSGQFDINTILRTLGGNRGIGANANAASRSINSIEDVLSYRSNNREAISQLIEAEPGIMQGLQVSSVMDLAREQGMDIEQMSQGELAQFAGMTGMMTPDQFKAAAAATRALPETFARRRAEERRTAEARAQNMYDTSFIGEVGESLRENEITREVVSTGSQLERATRDNVYEANQWMSNFFTETFQGRSQVTVDGGAMEFFRNLELSDEQQRRVDDRGTYYEDFNDLFAPTDASDILQQSFRTGDREDVRVIRGNRYSEGGNTVELTPEEIEDFASREGVEGLRDRGEETGTQDRRRYSFDELAESGLMVVEGESAQFKGENFIPNILAKDFAGAFGGIAQQARGISGNQLYITSQKEEDSVQETRRALAEQLRGVRTSDTKSIRQLSDPAMDAYQDLTDVLDQTSRDEWERIIGQTGEEGSRQITTKIQETIKEVGDLSGDLGSQELQKQVTEYLDENPAMKDAMSVALPQYGGGADMEKVLRGMDTYLSTGMSTTDMRETVKDTESSLVNTADTMFDWRGGGTLGATSRFAGRMFRDATGLGWDPMDLLDPDPMIENALDTDSGRDNAMVLLAERTFGEETIEESGLEGDVEEARKYFREEGVSMERLDTVLSQVEKQEGDGLKEKMYGYLKMAQEEKIAGEGEQTISSSGAEQRVGDSDRDVREQARDHLRSMSEILSDLATTSDNLMKRSEKIAEDDSWF